MKDIKKYLHFYLGCEGRVSIDYGPPMRGMKIVECVLIGIVGEIVTLDCFDIYGNKWDAEHICHYNRFKPILRPLSGMTEKEALGLATLKISPMRVIEILQITDDGVEFKYESFEQDRKMYLFKDELSPEMFRLLCKAGFDLFGLLNQGLAIDKTKLPTNER